MKIGDKVRFLNSVGGGIVKRFQGKDIILVEEEDGFETPVLIKECIVVGSDDMQIKSSSKAAMEKTVQEIPIQQEPEEEYKIIEIAGNDHLNVHLAYLPVNIKELGKGNYETYLINDSNYYLFVNYMNRENNSWFIRYNGEIEPNTRIFIEEFSKEQINDLEKICIQFIAYKKDKPFNLKNSYSVELRIDGVKFYKLHSFKENDFFEDEALIYTVVENDLPVREMLVSASDLQESFHQKIRIDQPVRKLPREKKNKPEIIEIDLHINELVDTTAGLENKDILEIQLNKFHEILNENASKKGQKIVFIHGKGEGVLRNAIIAEIKQKYKKYLYQDASFKEYGFGATMITIK